MNTKIGDHLATTIFLQFGRKIRQLGKFASSIGFSKKIRLFVLVASIVVWTSWQEIISDQNNTNSAEILNADIDYELIVRFWILDIFPIIQHQFLLYFAKNCKGWVGTENSGAYFDKFSWNGNGTFEKNYSKNSILYWNL